LRFAEASLLPSYLLIRSPESFLSKYFFHQKNCFEAARKNRNARSKESVKQYNINKIEILLCPNRKENRACSPDGFWNNAPRSRVRFLQAFYFGC